jgi:predicted nucleotidyltransferase
MSPLGLRQQPGRLSRLSGPPGRRLRRHRQDLIIAAAAHGVSNLRVFGSVARGDDHPDSDVDLLADLPPGLSLFGSGRVEADLSANPEVLHVMRDEAAGAAGLRQSRSHCRTSHWCADAEVVCGSTSARASRWLPCWVRPARLTITHSDPCIGYASYLTSGLTLVRGPSPVGMARRAGSAGRRGEARR